MKKTIKTFLLTSSLLFVLPLAACNTPSSIQTEDNANKFKVSEVSLDLHEYTFSDVDENLHLNVNVTYKDGEDLKLTPTWKTSDPLVATVDSDGLVTSTGPGVAVISVIVGFKSDMCRINVPGGETPEEPFTLSITPSSLELTVGESSELHVSSSKPATLTWTSSNPSVASVSGGTVSAIAPGSAVITATAFNTNATCLVQVNEVGAFTIRLDNSSLEMSEGTSHQIVATTSEPANVSWSSSEESVATVNSNGVVNALSIGTTIITASANGKSATCTVTVTPSEEEETDCNIYFFIDYNNNNPNDTTGTQLLAKFRWYSDRPLSASGQVPSDPTTPLDPAFPYFIGWSSHSVVDSKDQLWDMDVDVVGNANFIYIYGVWSDVPKGEFTK